MKAIQTRYYGPTNTRGARIKAWAEGVGSIFVPYPYGRNDGQDAHQYAAECFSDRVGWDNALVGGGLPNGDYAFCMIPK
jgi:hypothetical protein